MMVWKLKMPIDKNLICNTESTRTSVTLTQTDLTTPVITNSDKETALKERQQKLDRLSELYEFLDLSHWSASHILEKDEELAFDKTLVICLTKAVDELVCKLLDKKSISKNSYDQLPQAPSFETNNEAISKFVTPSELNEIINKIESAFNFKMNLNCKEELIYKEDIQLHTKITLIQHLQDDEKLLSQSLDKIVLVMPELSIRFKANCCYKVLEADPTKIKIAAVDYSSLEKLFECGVLKDISWRDLNLLMASALESIRNPQVLSGLPEDDRVHCSLIGNFLKLMKARKNDSLYRNIFLEYLDKNRKYLTRLFFEPISSKILSFTPFEGYKKDEDLRVLKSDLLKFSLENADDVLLKAVLGLKIPSSYRVNEGDCLILEVLKNCKDPTLMLNVLFEFDVNVDSNTIFFAIDRDLPESVSALLEYSLSSENYFSRKLLNEGLDEILSYAIKKQRSGCFEAITHKLVNDTYVNSQGDSLLMMLASSAGMSSDKSLINRLAGNSSLTNFQNIHGVTALMRAACCGHLTMVDFLLNEKKAEIDLTENNGCDALILLMIELINMNEHQPTQNMPYENLSPYLEIAKLLINAGAKITRPELNADLQIEELARKSQLKPLIELVESYKPGKRFSGIQLA